MFSPRGRIATFYLKQKAVGRTAATISWTLQTPHSCILYGVLPSQLAVLCQCVNVGINGPPHFPLMCYSWPRSLAGRVVQARPYNPPRQYKGPVWKADKPKY